MAMGWQSICTWQRIKIESRESLTRRSSRIGNLDQGLPLATLRAPTPRIQRGQEGPWRSKATVSSEPHCGHTFSMCPDDRPSRFRCATRQPFAALRMITVRRFFFDRRADHHAARVRGTSPKCPASTLSVATSMPCACSGATGRPPRPWRMAHSRTDISRPMTCHAQEPAALSWPPRASRAVPILRRASM